jgi:nucleoid-associated protein YgaU
VAYTFRDYLRDRGEFLGDEDVYGREGISERVFREFKLGVFTMFVITLLLVTLFWDERRDEGERRGRPSPAEVDSRPPRRTGIIPDARAETNVNRNPAQAGSRRNAGAPPVAAAGAVQGGQAPGARPPGVAAQAATQAAAPGEYVVRRGDTLYSISRRLYGDGNSWRLILRANSGILSCPEDLEVGMRLRIPPRDVR